jgi:cullin 3
VTIIIEAKDTGLHHMLKFNKCDDLATMYKLFEHIEICHSTMVDYLSVYLREQGRILVTENTEERKSPITYVQVKMN